MHFLTERFSSNLLIFYTFRTSCVHHQEAYIVLYMQPYVLCFSCIYASSLAGGRMCSINKKQNNILSNYKQLSASSSEALVSIHQTTRSGFPVDRNVNSSMFTKLSMFVMGKHIQSA